MCLYCIWFEELPMRWTVVNSIYYMCFFMFSKLLLFIKNYEMMCVRFVNKFHFILVEFYLHFKENTEIISDKKKKWFLHHAFHMEHTHTIPNTRYSRVPRKLSNTPFYLSVRHHSQWTQFKRCAVTMSLTLNRIK